MGLSDAYQQYLGSLQQREIQSNPYYFTGQAINQTPIPYMDNPWANVAAQFIKGLVGGGLTNYGYNQGMQAVQEQAAPVLSQMMTPEGLQALGSNKETAGFFQAPLIEYTMQRKAAQDNMRDQLTLMGIQTAMANPRQADRVAEFMNRVDFKPDGSLAIKPSVLPTAPAGVTLASDGVGGLGNVPSISDQVATSYQTLQDNGVDEKLALSEAQAGGKLERDLAAEAIKQANADLPIAERKKQIAEEILSLADQAGNYNAPGSSLTDVGLWVGDTLGIDSYSQERAARSKLDSLIEELGLKNKPTGSGAMSDREQAIYRKMAEGGIVGQASLKNAAQILSRDAEAAIQKARFMQLVAPTKGATEANRLYAAYVNSNPAITSDEAGNIFENPNRIDLATYLQGKKTSPTVGAPEVKQAKSAGKSDSAAKIQARSDEILQAQLAKEGLL